MRAYSGAETLTYTVSAGCPTPSNFSTSPSNTIAAVVLLLPLYTRPSWFEPLIAWHSGLLSSLFSFSLRGVWRIAVTFEGNIKRMIS